MEEKRIPPSCVMPSAFGPASWYGTPEKLIPIYRQVRWHKDEAIDPADPPPPLELEESPGAFYPRSIVLPIRE